ncbi:hypothetical protein A9Q81_25210 [Gammaproteobacteria bacterium 42_54_T18]|nr:hypothetical protein A9Q81_25210 [Gammaproteobacteria bacterium 42_54_T18]
MDKQDIVARRGIAELALKGFFDIAHRWKLSRQDAMTLLGLTATSTYANWKNGKTGTLPRDTLERISYLLNIDDVFKKTNPNIQSNTTHMLHTPHPELHYESPLDRMLQGNVADIYVVQQIVQ